MEWNGRVDVLEQLLDKSKIGDMDLSNLHLEDWIKVRVEYKWDENEYDLHLFPIGICDGNSV
ncbi:MAG: hypothetical protein M0P12_03060 [Paludibacteraceae bacterium]|nr:hypothetical protein [Paludibacteraceae bacterium]